MRLGTIFISILALTISACATFKEGDKAKEAELRLFSSIPGKVSLYVCRVGGFVARGVSSVVFVDNEAIGTLKTNTFVHATLEPGKHGVLLRHDGLASGGGGFETFTANANDVTFFWVGVTGRGWGVLTIDRFDSDADAKACIAESRYSVKAD